MACGVLLALLKVVEYQYFVRAYPAEVYGGLVAVIFSQMLPDFTGSTTDVFIGVAAVVVVNSGITLVAARHRWTIRSTGLAFAARQRFDRTLRFDESLEAKVSALTPEQISAAFRKHIDAANLIYVKAGDFKKAGVLQ